MTKMNTIDPKPFRTRYFINAKDGRIVNKYSLLDRLQEQERVFWVTQKHLKPNKLELNFNSTILLAVMV
ncbi:hypothetical protein P7H12_21275 [Paenibacillus larvae]|nr:hypothetical protein [Paenibacillus larvae]MDT2265597.1 hypothetical protein [Paenibacillus larvae]